MKKPFIYIGAHVLPKGLDPDLFKDNKLHITLAYAEAEATEMMNLDIIDDLTDLAVTVDSVVYWDKVDKTVMLVSNDLLGSIQERLESAGFGYNHQFCPHVTLGKGDITKTAGNLALGYSSLIITDVYMQVVMREVVPPAIQGERAHAEPKPEASPLPEEQDSSKKKKRKPIASDINAFLALRQVTEEEE
ncbi:hypothetical protein S0112_035 [Shewanella phage S0112]|nr:hypothetical protein S0112_035 [Shewanella phage S0112]